RPVWRQRLFATIARHKAVKDQIVLVGLSRIKHGLAAGGLDAGDCADKLLGERIRVLRLPFFVLAIFGLRYKADLVHEALPATRADDEFVVCLAVILFLAALAIRHQARPGLAALQNATQDAEVRQQHLHVFEKSEAARGQPDRASSVGIVAL